MTRRRLIVHGRVQGVGFRYAAVARARALGLRGWARNLPDGTVELVAEGSPEHLAELRDWAQLGPPGARVTRVDQTPAPPGALDTEFHIRV